MKKEIADRWVAALESGEYKQGQRRLRCNDEYCSLGVLCDLYSKETGIEWQSFFFNPLIIDKFQFDSHSATLPFSVRQWAQMIGQPALLITMNDKGSSFQEIANVIKENWKNL